MKARKSIILLFVLLFVSSLSLFAQVEDVGEPQPEQLGVDSAQQMLRTVSISKFEDAGFWGASMPHDQGIVTIRSLQGAPLDKEPLEGEQEAGIDLDDDKVLGAKVEFFKRGLHHVSILPSRPLPVEGISKTLSLWVVGRNSPHTLKVLIRDQFGNSGEVTMGKLNFTGWKKMVATIPTNIKQRDYHYSNKMGIQVEGFRIDMDLEETFGTYYIYFDGLRATTDLFAEESRDVDDMSDNW
ncbi:MAG: flagellar filament outer layer protein FlaA [Spirochaetia bacterium]|nr:flagellar filament outer layer protein FlaA [Spirochaetia bacterium]